MNTPDYILNVNEADFEFEVIQYSQQIPVVVDFWAEWCGPCKLLGPILEKLAKERQGEIRLAKVDVDENPNLALRFNVRGIPAVKAFRDGRVVAEFTGAQPEPRVREFLNALAPGAASLALEKGQSLVTAEDWAGAEKAFRQALAESPAQPAALLGLIKSLLAQGQVHEALSMLDAFPPSKEYNAAELLRPLASALSQASAGQADAALDENELEAAYHNALRLIRRGNLPAAIDGLLDIIRQDRRFRSGEPRRLLVALFELLGEENPLVPQYRGELASILF
jgi:putative thioredoxin